MPNPRSDNKTHSGILLHISPPVQLNPDTVERYLTFGDFEPIDSRENWARLDVKDVVLLGSTPEQTTIYASIIREYDKGILGEQAAQRTIELLRFMGATAIIDHPPKQET
ncbi:MAG TPA: hypothetical protein VJ761_02240 [Ktedonobacteraceae bacterium]|nr:hypothetical protein [Ktedonobacteraceae bacterium]